MAETQGPIPGKLVKLFRANEIPVSTYTALGCLTTQSMEISATALQQACKDSGGWSVGAQGDKSGSVSFTLVLRHDVAIGNAEIFSDLNDGLTRSWQWTSNVAGDEVYTFDAYVSSWGQNADATALADVPVTLTISGAVVRTIVA